MKNALIRRSAFTTTLLLTALSADIALAQSTAFTYQGRLEEAGVPADGVHDFVFRLFGAASGGVQVGQTFCMDDVDVVKGLFTVLLDFGQQYATTAERHLEIELRVDAGLDCSNGTGFLVLSPRQQLTATPLASHAKSAFALDAADGSPANAVFVDNNGNVGLGTTSPTTKLHVNGDVGWGGTFTDLASSGQDGFGVYLEQRGSSSAKSKIRLQTSKSGDLANYSQFFIDPNAGFAFTALGTGNGNVGIGTTTPAAKLDVRGDIRLGPNGQFRAASGEENLRIVRGVVLSDGSIHAGLGFTVTPLATGRYRINFQPAFAGAPAVTVDAQFNTGPFFCLWGDLFSTRVEIRLQNNSGFSNGDFSFIAIGPR